MYKSDDHSYMLLMDHFPEVTQRTLDWALSCNNQIIMGIFPIDAANAVRIDVPLVGFITLGA